MAAYAPCSTSHTAMRAVVSASHLRRVSDDGGRQLAEGAHAEHLRIAGLPQWRPTAGSLQCVRRMPASAATDELTVPQVQILQQGLLALVALCWAVSLLCCRSRDANPWQAVEIGHAAQQDRNSLHPLHPGGGSPRAPVHRPLSRCRCYPYFRLPAAAAATQRRAPAAFSALLPSRRGALPAT
jgi:hypothetical protein